jgi:hypothetical protein
LNDASIEASVIWAVKKWGTHAGTRGERLPNYDMEEERLPLYYLAQQFVFLLMPD